MSSTPLIWKVHTGFRPADRNCECSVPLCEPVSPRTEEREDTEDTEGDCGGARGDPHSSSDSPAAPQDCGADRGALLKVYVGDVDPLRREGNDDTQRTHH